MSERNDGGPAFPRDERFLGHNGMTLRDWFAGQMLPQIVLATLTNDTVAGGVLENAGGSAGAIQQKLSALAYSYADAMLEARES